LYPLFFIRKNAKVIIFYGGHQIKLLFFQINIKRVYVKNRVQQVAGQENENKGENIVPVIQQVNHYKGKMKQHLQPSDKEIPVIEVVGFSQIAVHHHQSAEHCKRQKIKDQQVENRQVIIAEKCGEKNESR
jgi:hypothetical protein